MQCGSFYRKCTHIGLQCVGDHRESMLPGQWGFSSRVKSAGGIWLYLTICLVERMSFVAGMFQNDL